MSEIEHSVFRSKVTYCPFLNVIYSTPWCTTGVLVRCSLYALLDRDLQYPPYMAFSSPVGLTPLTT